VKETVAWLRDRPYYEGQVETHRVVPGREATHADVAVEDRVADALADDGIDRLYAHQARAVEAVRGGDDVVLATPTASGKSLAYAVPAFERALADRATTLYVAPQVALINDQAETLSALADRLGFASGVRVDRYTGQLSRSEKRAVRDRQPTVLLITPDMLHYGITPHGHRLWDWFLERLETVVIDEVHESRGVFGSHVALVLRRLNRLCERFDADPDYVCCSATIGNPVDHAAGVTGRPADGFTRVDQDESATGPTHWLVWNPPEYDDVSGAGRGGSGAGPDGGSGHGGRRKSAHAETKRLFVDLVERGYQTVAFASSRQGCERYASESADALRDRRDHDLARDVAAYQAALPDDRREAIEAGLQSGDLRGVWSTNALELGIDVGGLDAVLLDGYPGTRMNTVQQAGRAGRGTDPSLVVLVAGEDQLDQYVAANPDVLFDERPERAVTDPANGTLLPDHVASAARETWLRPDDDRHFGETFPDVVADLERTGVLDRRETDGGMRWVHDGDGSPQHEMSLRTVGDRKVKLRSRGGDDLGSLSIGDALRDVHEGAVYHHQGRTYEVVDLDLTTDVAVLDRTWANYHTKTLHDKTITVEEDLRETAFDAREDVTVRFADVTMRKQITGFERRDAASGEALGRQPLDLPETTLRTTALYYVLPSELEADLRALDGGFDGGIHATEHAMISMFPMELLCDRRDVGGLSTPLHPHTGRATVFVYDGHPGGVGLARNGYESVDRLAAITHEMVTGCDCADGCPACVQSPHCGNANDPLDKAIASELLGEFAGE
jgi:DEAD/DEAH box helicase domain-containing protein